MAKTKQAAGSIESWLRQLPGPMYSEVSPQRVFQDAHQLYAATCSDPEDLGTFTDHLWARGLTLEVVGTRYFLKLPGVAKGMQRQDTPTRIV